MAPCMCGNLDQHHSVEQTIKMRPVVGGKARNNTPDSPWRAEEITRSDAQIKDFFSPLQLYAPISPYRRTVD